MPKLSQELKPAPEKEPEEKKVSKKSHKEFVESLSPTLIATEKTEVYMEKGVTKNMGDYNSARVIVGIKLPLNPTKEQILEAKDTMKIASDLLDMELEKQIKELNP